MNLLLITADQWRGDCLGAVGHPAAHTPNLDALAAEAVLFRRHHGQATPCGPARASLHTGLYAFNHRSITNGTPLDARHRTFAAIARAAGHDPVLFGYTDTSADPRTLPADDPALRTYESVAPGYRALLHLPEDHAAWLDHLAARGHGRRTLDELYGVELGEPAPFPAEDSETAFVADSFLAWLERQPKGRGWLAHVSWLRPHPPWVAAAPWHRLIDPSLIPEPRRAPTIEAEAALHPWLAAHLALPFGKPWPPGHPEAPRDLTPAMVRRLAAIYLGLAAEVDHHLGRIVEALVRRDMLDDTLLVFTADHGEMLGDHWMLGKSGFFPAAFHVPLLIRAPGGVGGRRVDAFTEHVDLMPTLLEALDLPVPLQCDGRSLWPWLGGATPDGWREATHFEHDFRDVETRRYEHLLGLDPDACGLQVRLDRRFAYVHFTALPPLLLDHGADPAMIHDLAADPGHAGTMLERAQALLSFRMRTAERRLTGCKLTPEGPVGRWDPA